MPRLHALELVPDAAGDDAVRRDWQALRDAGLPSQLDHAVATNTPHVTVLALPELTPDTESRASGAVRTAASRSGSGRRAWPSSAPRRSPSPGSSTYRRL